MRPKKWQCKLLAGILCASMIFQSLSVTTYASEVDTDTQITAEQTQEDTTVAEVVEEDDTVETKQAAEAEIEEVVVEEAAVETVEEASTENVADEQTSAEETTTKEETTEENTTEVATVEEETTEETTEVVTTEEATIETATTEEVATEEETVEEETTEEEITEEMLYATDSEVGSFADITMEFGGFDGYITGGQFVLNDCSDKIVDLIIAQYDKNANILCRSSLEQFRYSSGETYNFQSYSKSFAILQDTSYVRLEVYAGGDRNEKPDVVSESFSVGTRPNVNFILDDWSVETGSLAASISYEGDLRLHSSKGANARVKLCYGTSQDESTWTEINSSRSLSYSKYSDLPQNVVFSGLAAGQKYYGKLIVYKEILDWDSWEHRNLYEQEISLGSFTMKSGNTYNLKTAFPDPVLRTAVLNGLYNNELTENDNVSSTDLEKINYLNISKRTDPATEAVQDLTGLDLLTGLTYLNLEYHEVNDITGIDWSKLTRLESIYLDGNNITALPDWSKNTKLNRIQLDENKLSEQALANAYSKIPAGTTLTCDRQRTEGFGLQLEDNYYIYSSGSGIYVQPTGYKTAFPYTMKFYIDDNEQTFVLKNSYDYIYGLEDVNLSPGEHKIRAELILNGAVEEESEEYTFSIKDENIFLENGKYYINNNQTYISPQVYSKSNKTVNKISMINDVGRVYAETESAVYPSINWQEPRFTKFTNLSVNKVYYAYASMQLLYNTIPAGTYDLKFEYADGTSDILEDMIISGASEEVTITRCNIGYDYDNTGEYIYLALDGNNIDPSKLEYTLSKNGVTYPVTYVNYKQVSSGVIVKLRKNGWTTLTSGSVDVKITGKSGYTVVSGDILNRTISTGIYYSAYNMLTGKLEVAFSTSINSENKSVKISVREGWDTNQYPEIANGTATISDGMAYFELKNPDGTVHVPTKRMWYYFTCTLNGVEYTDSAYVETKDYQKNYWNSTTNIVLEGQKQSSFWYYTDIPFNDTNAKESLYSAKVTGEKLASPIIADDIWTYESSASCVTIGMRFNTADLAVGTYQVTVCKGEEELSSNSFVVNTTDKFRLNYISATWISKESFRLYVCTPNIGASDSYDITLTDLEGNEVSGLTIEEAYRNDTYVDYIITGLNYADAATKYYIKVIHKTLGEPYTSSDTAYYSDDKGELISIYSNNVGSLFSHNRLIGLALERAEFPLKIKIYKPYETDVIKEYTLNSRTDTSENTYYYFTKALYDILPVKDAAYHVIVIEDNNRVTTFTEILGYSNMAEEEKVWSYKIDRNTLYLNTEDEKTATIIVQDYKKAPTFKSSDTSVVTVAADKEDPSKAVVTAVGLGLAKITITADGISQSFEIAVDRKVSVEELILNKTELTLGVGNSCELAAAVRPMEAWTEESTITFTSSDETVVAIADGASEEIATITALKAGTATITATLDGTEYKATCTVTVTGVYTPEEQANKVQEVGTTFVLLNAYDKNAATLADVDLPDGWSWVDGTVKLVADNAAPVQKYMACFESEGYEAFTALLPVAVSKLTGIGVTGGTKILTGKDANSDIVFKYTGYQPEADEYDEYLTCSWTAAGNAPIVKVKTPSAKSTVITAQEGITKNTSQFVNIVVTVNNDAKKTFKAALKITVIPEPYVDSITVKKAPEQLETEVTNVFEGNVLKVDYANISTVKNEVANTVRFEATAFTGGAETVLPKGLKWTTSDSSVVTVKAEKDSRFAVVTVKKAGSAAIQVTSTDSGKFVQEFEVNVTDYAPIIDNRNITVNLNSTAGTVIPVMPQNGNTITDVKILENGVESEKFTVTKDGNNFILKTKEGYTVTKNQKVKAVLDITTSAGPYNDSKAQAVNITIDVKKPTASVKVKAKANLFYTLCAAVYTVSSKNEIASIEDVTGDITTRFKAYYNKEQGVIYFTPDLSLTSETLAEFKNKNSAACKVKLKINFVGYSEEVSQIINVTVATEEKKPSWKLDDLILMPGVTSGVVNVIDTKTKQVVGLAGMKDVIVTSDSSKTHDVTTAKTGDSVAVNYAPNTGYENAAYKSATYKAQISFANCTSAVTVNGKITVANNQNLVLSNPKVILNTAHNIQENGKLAIGVSVKNHDGAIQRIKYQIDKKNAALFNNGYLSITYNAEKQEVYVGLNKGNRGNIKAGSYKVNLYGTVLAGTQEVEIKPATLTVTLVDKAPTISLKAKGSIDLVRRDTTSIVYTPYLGNVTAKVESVKLTGSYAGYFTASVENGTVVLKATNQPMSTKLTYPVTMELTLDNDSTVKTTVKVKPVNKTPKLAAGLTNKTLYKTSPETASFMVTSKSSDDTKIAEITRVEDKNSKYFNFAYDNATQTVSVSLTDAARKLKPGKYIISYQVKMEGAAYNVKPTTMKLTVTVK